MRGTQGQRLPSIDILYRAVPHPSRLRRATFPQRGKALDYRLPNKSAWSAALQAEDDPNRRHSSNVNDEKLL